MPKIDVMKQIVEELAPAFPKLTPWNEIYLSPKVMALPAAAPLEIQVCEGKVTYIDHEGTVRREQFDVDVGILCKYRLDAGGRHSKALTELTRSLWVIKKQVIDQLDGSFLEGDLLTRPLLIVQETAVTEITKGQLVKVLTFTAGLNSMWAE